MFGVRRIVGIDVEEDARRARRRRRVEKRRALGHALTDGTVRPVLDEQRRAFRAQRELDEAVGGLFARRALRQAVRVRVQHGGRRACWPGSGATSQSRFGTVAQRRGEAPALQEHAEAAAANRASSVSDFALRQRRHHLVRRCHERMKSSAWRAPDSSSVKRDGRCRSSTMSPPACQTKGATRISTGSNPSP